MLIENIRPSRRAFLAGSAGLVIGFYLAPTGRARAAVPIKEGVPADAVGTQFAPNAFVRIAPDDTVTVLCKHTEIGQGVYTGLPTIVAEELDADWSQMRAVASPSNDDLYANLAFGTIMGTGGSTAIANSYTQMRTAGATARAMLVAAAASEWGVPEAEITVESGRIRHAASGRESGFGALAERAAAVKLQGEPKLKDPKNFRLIGSDIHRLDTQAKSTGKAIYTIDISLPDMLTVLVLHPDVFGAKVKSFDDSAARSISGVVDVKAVPQGVAVYAETMWAAILGRAAVKVEWDTSTAETRSSATIIAEYRDKAKAPGVDVANEGDVTKAYSEAKQTLEAEYIFPYLAHSPMEPLDSVMVKADDGTIDIYSGSQLQTIDLKAVAGGLGLDPGKVRLHTQLAGGGFGRRGEAGFQYSTEAAAVFKASGGDRPIKHIWLREDDVRGGNYRPIYVHRVKGAVGADGAISAYEHVIVGQSILAGTAFEGFMQGGPDPTSHEGASDLPYAIANKHVSLHTTQTGVPVLWWRSVGHTHTAYSTECFIDELLAAAGKDPVEGRLAMLGGFPRHSGVLQRVAEIADSPVPEGRARGVAVHKSFNTYVAEIAEVSVENGLPRVHKVWCAVDCGVPVNPNVIRAQMEGGIGFGLGAILFGEISLGDGGRVQQSNFHDYRMLRINEMPEIDVAVIPSTEAPTGVGEPGVPPIGPAVANAWRRLTGEPVRQLPFQAPASGSLS
jgi:isoquinoline 1-oxidoreductase beta subunit